MTTVRDRVSILDTALAEITERAARAAERLERLNAQIEVTERRLARGSSDVTADAAEVARETEHITGRRSRRDTIPMPEPVVPEAALEQALRTKPAGLADLSKALGLPVGRVSIMLAKLRRAQQVVNLGTAEAPRWAWIVGDEATTEQLYQAIEAMIAERPMTFAELLAATGSTRIRVSSILVNLQRKGRPIVNLGTERRARWFLAAK